MRLITIHNRHYHEYPDLEAIERRLSALLTKGERFMSQVDDDIQKLKAAVDELVVVKAKIAKIVAAANTTSGTVPEDLQAAIDDAVEHVSDVNSTTPDTDAA